MRRVFLSLPALSLLALTLAVAPRSAGAQGFLDAIKKKAEEAKKVADAVKRKADSIEAITDAAKAAGSGGQQARAGAAPARGGAAQPNATQAGGPVVGGQSLSRNAAKVEDQTMFVTSSSRDYTISPHGQHLTASVLKGTRVSMSYDGTLGPAFQEIVAPGGGSASYAAFSEDGNHYAYFGRSGPDWVVMLDGKEIARGHPFRTVSGNTSVGTMGFSPKGKHLWFIAIDEQGAPRFYFDGKPDPSTVATTPVLSPDGEHYAYSVQQNNGETVTMVDGKRVPYPAASLQYTTDGHLYATVNVPRANAIDVLVDGRPIMRVQGITFLPGAPGSAMFSSVLTVSPQGQRSTFLAIGNKRVPNSDCHGNAGVNGAFFSDDGKHWAIRCQDTNSSYWIMTDGRKGQEYTSITSGVTFTADGRPVYSVLANNKAFLIVGDHEIGPFETIVAEAHAVGNKPGTTLYPAVVAGNHVGLIGLEAGGARSFAVVVDGKAFKSPNATNLTFNHDGSHFAYLEGLGPYSVVLDGVQRLPLPAAKEIIESPIRLVFSPDGKHLAYQAESSAGAKGHAVAIDDGMFATGSFAHYDVTFTPDSRHLVWYGIGDGTHRRIYVDGDPVYEFDDLAGAQSEIPTWWEMSGDGTLSALVRGGEGIKRVRITPTGGSIDKKSRAR